MRNTSGPAAITLIAPALLALAGCDRNPEPQPGPTEAESPGAAGPARAPSPAPSVAPGSYEATSADGRTVTKVTVQPDGSYAQSTNGGLTIAGIVRIVNGKRCFDPSGPQGPTCYEDSMPEPDGTFRARAPDGAVETVRRLPD